MTKFDEVTATLGNLPTMNEDRARELCSFILEHGAAELLEIGFFHGKSSAYLAAILEDQGRGHLTTIDRVNVRVLEPSIFETLARVGLTHRVTPIFAPRSPTWELCKMIQDGRGTRFDVCYFDGRYTRDVTGLDFVLVDALLKPGGWIVCDGPDWTIADAFDRKRTLPPYDAEERQTNDVRLAFEIIGDRVGYRTRLENNGWGFAQKPRKRGLFDVKRFAFPWEQ